MPVFVSVPTLLRSYTQDSKRVQAQGTTVREVVDDLERRYPCLLYTSPSPRDATLSRMPSSA